MDRREEADANRVAAVGAAKSESRERISLAADFERAKEISLHAGPREQRFQKPLHRAGAVSAGQIFGETAVHAFRIDAPVLRKPHGRTSGVVDSQASFSQPARKGARPAALQHNPKPTRFFYAASDR